jgi:hypothetical protein
VTRTCPNCGISVEHQTHCPLCDASLLSVNLRRVLLWALVVEEYLVVLALGLHRGLA